MDTPLDILGNHTRVTIGVKPGHWEMYYCYTSINNIQHLTKNSLNWILFVFEIKNFPQPLNLDVSNTFANMYFPR